jgi:hypothetical protein
MMLPTQTAAVCVPFQQHQHLLLLLLMLLLLLHTSAALAWQTLQHSARLWRDLTLRAKPRIVCCALPAPALCRLALAAAGTLPSAPLARLQGNSTT